jgi:hypothetical protein
LGKGRNQFPSFLLVKAPIPLLPIVLIGLLGGVFLLLGIPSLADTILLRSSDAEAVARVTDSRIVSAKYGLSHEVRYVFAVGGSEKVTRSDFLGRSDLWSTIPEEVWRVATVSKDLPVRYLRVMPSRNAPVAGLPSIWDDLTILGLGGLIFGFAVFAAWKRWRHFHPPAYQQFRA